MAFNFWFYPPSTPHATFDAPYPDEYWARRVRKILEALELEREKEFVEKLRASCPVGILEILDLLRNGVKPEMLGLDGGLMEVLGSGVFGELAASESDEDDAVTTPMKRAKMKKKKSKETKCEEKNEVKNKLNEGEVKSKKSEMGKKTLMPKSEDTDVISGDAANGKCGKCSAPV